MYTHVYNHNHSTTTNNDNIFSYSSIWYFGSVYFRIALTQEPQAFAAAFSQRIHQCKKWSEAGEGPGPEALGPMKKWV